MKYQWIWVLLKILAVLVVLSYLYFEIALIIKLFLRPALEASGNVKYQEGLGLFAPVYYMFEGLGKLLEGLSPAFIFIQKILLAINSVLLILSIIFTRYVFKKAIWAGILITLLATLQLVLWFG